MSLVEKKTKDFFMLPYSSLDKDWEKFSKNFTNEQIDYLLKSSTLPWPPPVVLLDITTTCNLDCPFCYNHSGAAISIFDKKRNSKVELLNFIKENGPFKTLAFSGAGEPFLYAESIEILEEAQEFCEDFAISTNLQTLNKEKIERLTKLNIKSIVVSSDAATKEEYEIFRKNGKFEIFKENIVLMYKAFGKKLSIMSVVFKQNTTSILEFPKFLNELGLSEVPLQIIRGIAHPEINKEIALKVPNEEMLEFLVLLQKESDKYGCKMSFSGSSLPSRMLPEQLKSHGNIYNSMCMQPFNHFQINIDGEVNHCCGGFQTLPKNAFNPSSKVHWNSEEVLRLRVMTVASYKINSCKSLCGKIFPESLISFETIQKRLHKLKNNIHLDEIKVMENILDYLKDMKYFKNQRIAIYGAGEFAQSLLNELEDNSLTVLAVFDDFHTGKKLNGVEVESFKKEKIENLEINILLIISRNFEEMMAKKIPSIANLKVIQLTNSALSKVI